MTNFEQYQVWDRLNAGREDDAPAVSSDPTCQHIYGCEKPGTVICQCSETICEDHAFVCAERSCDAMLCNGCGIESVHDQQYRCGACHLAHKRLMERELVTA